MAVTTKVNSQLDTRDLNNDDFNVLANAVNGIEAGTTALTEATVSGDLSVAGVASFAGNTLAVTAGTGITTGTGTIYEAAVEQVGSLFRTTILLDLTGLNSGGTAADIIGVNSAANCHIGQITALRNGAIFAGTMQCLEVPAGGEPNIDLYSATVATGTEDAAITALTETALLESSGDWTLALTQALTAFPPANDYLYLVAGDATSATYTAGKFLITLWGN